MKLSVTRSHGAWLTLAVVPARRGSVEPCEEQVWHAGRPLLNGLENSGQKWVVEIKRAGPFAQTSRHGTRFGCWLDIVAGPADTNRSPKLKVPSQVVEADSHQDDERDSVGPCANKQNA